MNASRLGNRRIYFVRNALLKKFMIGTMLLALAGFFCSAVPMCADGTDVSSRGVRGCGLQMDCARSMSSEVLPCCCDNSSYSATTDGCACISPVQDAQELPEVTPQPSPGFVDNTLVAILPMQSQPALRIQCTRGAVVFEQIEYEFLFLSSTNSRAPPHGPLA
jgi:hypothetical protein